MSRAALVKAGVLVLILLAASALALAVGTPDASATRARVDAAGVWAPVLFFALYAGLTLTPCPKGLLTAVSGALFGLWGGAALALGAALVSALVSFGLGRLLGRDLVDRLLRGRLARVDALLAHHGVPAVLVVRLVPLVPFFAINYAAGLTGVRFRHYVVATSIGMVPGTVAYAALGAYGTNPWGLAAVGSALVVLVAGGSWWARRLDVRQEDDPT